ncbi:hypothetical protein [Synechococcus sp. CS-1332]|uniref:hypothetical protein n=1 Tax=Synechococcus sp. CS-1332 TaxID=2847972 RepID=UPI00223B7031|nr:hypothetical protein [Synechococcus sp. CS-1332]MCT0208449.1 hypothetical protein [Synechococcus sp. CS-1332]
MPWDPVQIEAVIEALAAITTPPRRGEVQHDRGAPTSAAQSLGNPVAVVEPAAIFGGCPPRHIGHFLHEGLSRPWRLGQWENSDPLITGLRSRVQAKGADVVVFMLRWLDGGKDLPASMAGVLTGLRLPPE